MKRTSVSLEIGVINQRIINYKSSALSKIPVAYMSKVRNTIFTNSMYSERGKKIRFMTGDEVKIVTCERRSTNNFLLI